MQEQVWVSERELGPTKVKAFARKAKIRTRIPWAEISRRLIRWCYACRDEMPYGGLPSIKQLGADGGKINDTARRFAGMLPKQFCRRSWFRSLDFHKSDPDMEPVEFTPELGTRELASVLERIERIERAQADASDFIWSNAKRVVSDHLREEERVWKRMLAERVSREARRQGLDSLVDEAHLQAVVDSLHLRYDVWQSGLEADLHRRLDAMHEEIRYDRWLRKRGLATPKRPSIAMRYLRAVKAGWRAMWKQETSNASH